jgi:hypothetical protein
MTYGMIEIEIINDNELFIECTSDQVQDKIAESIHDIMESRGGVKIETNGLRQRVHRLKVSGKDCAFLLMDALFKEGWEPFHAHQVWDSVYKSASYYLRRQG